jgi:signal transduction histidine kinase
MREQTGVTVLPTTDGETRRRDEPLRDVWAALDTPVVVLDVDEAGVLRWEAMNPAQERCLRGTFSSLRGLPLHAPSEFALEEWLVVHARACVVRAERFTIEPEQPEASSGRWIARTLTPCLGDDGRVHRVIVTGTDVTEQHRLATLLVQATRMDAVARVAGTTAREFNNIMVAISGYAGLGLRGLPPEAERAREHLSEISRLTETASSLTRRMLAFARRQQGAAVLVRLDEVALSMERVLRRYLQDRVTLTVRRSDELWHVKVDPHQIEQVLLHLAACARSSMPCGGTLSIEASNEILSRDEARSMGVGPGEHVILSVRDTGEGFDAQALQRAFDVQDNAVLRGDTELGLATSYGIVRQLGGAITVTSTVQQGTTFRIHLPRSIERATPSGISIASAHLRGHETVLAVGLEAISEAMSRTLRMLGYTVLESPSPEEAQKLVASQGRAPIDLVVIGGDPSRAEALALLHAVMVAHGPVAVLTTTVRGEWTSPGELSALRITLLPAMVGPAGLARRVREVLDRSRAQT